MEVTVSGFVVSSTRRLDESEPQQWEWGERMIIFNFPGIIMLGLSFGLAFGVTQQIGIKGEGPPMLLGGLLAGACDLVYRLKREEGHLFYPSGGGSLFFLPVWLFAIIWVLSGAFKTIMSWT
jgi:hypothetical protein